MRMYVENREFKLTHAGSEINEYFEKHKLDRSYSGTVAPGLVVLVICPFLFI